MKRAVDRAPWTATGIALGAGLMLIAVTIYIRGEWV